MIVAESEVLVRPLVVEISGLVDLGNRDLLVSRHAPLIFYLYEVWSRFDDMRENCPSCCVSPMT